MKRDGHMFCCRACAAKHRDTDRSIKKKRDIINDLFGGKCAICGYCDNVYAFDFHHVNPETKLRNVDGRSLDSPSLEVEVRGELKKCIAVCCNCHRALHYGYLPLHPKKDDEEPVTKNFVLVTLT